MLKATRENNLYTSVPTVRHEIQALRFNILEDIPSSNEHEIEGISVTDILNEIIELKHKNQMSEQRRILITL